MLVMTKINIDNWGNFKVGELFDIHPTKSYNLTNNYLFENSGDIPVIVNSSFNNGIGGYVSLPPTEKGGIITFSDTTSATAIFYQPKDFVGYSHIQGMYPKCDKWTDKSMLFFLTIFKKSAFLLGFDYVNKFTRDIAREIIVKLPIDETGNIDWNYIEKYMDNYFNENDIYIEKISKISSFKKEKVDISNWKNFRIGDLFNIVSPKVYHTKDVIEDIDGIPYVVRSKFNNGIKYNVIKDDNFITNPSGTISFGAENATFFYQDKEFISGRDMYYIDTRNISKKSSLFIASCLQMVAKKYSYNYGLFPKLLKEEIIKLPIDNYGNPNWDYMENYIDNLPYGNEL